jgi:UDP-glucose 4-epimerase
MDKNTKKILVTGGAGFIGSQMVDMLLKNGYDPVALDDLSTGFKQSVLGANLIVGNFGDEKLLDQLFAEQKFAAVMHFAAFIQVGESVNQPVKYYHNNVGNTLTLLETMVRHKIKCFIFSSTAAVYGEPEFIPINEQHPKNPVNPYGRSKYIIEQILPDYESAYGLRSIALRYFNAAGADPEGRIGPRHEPASHLIPLVLQAASGRKSEIAIFGKDYPTKDGTCLRDYIHIVDLCSAHLLALEKLLQGGSSNVYNLGNGSGYSVLEVIETAKNIAKRPIKAVENSRRAGDPAVLVADSSKAKTELNWHPKYPDIENIIKHAWEWEKKLANKY